MKKIIALTVFTILIFIAGCKPDEVTGDVKIQFTATYDGEELAFNTGYPYFNGANIQFLNFRFFISDVRLLKDGKETNIFNQIVIGSVPNSTVGNVGLFEIYGGQTLAEAQAETNLLQTFDVRTTATSAYASDPVSEQTRFTFDWDPTTGTFTNETQHTIG